jgi:hypothetical protein
LAGLEGVAFVHRKVLQFVKDTRLGDDQIGDSQFERGIGVSACCACWVAWRAL